MTETGADRRQGVLPARTAAPVGAVRDAQVGAGEADGGAVQRAGESAAEVPPADAEVVCPTELTRELNDVENRAWAAFLRSHASVTRRLEADLLAASHLPLAEYDVLTHLAAAEGGRLRMHELADRVLLSRAGLTRLIDRLVDDGLVLRAKCGGDGRGAYAVLTENGRAHFRAAAPQHMDSVKRHFLDAYSPADLERLADLLERVPGR